MIPLIVVVPGIIAYVMNIDATGAIVGADFINANGSVVNDNAAPWLIKNFVPAGFKGLVLAALAAAVVSSLASMLNSTATIFTMDIYLPYINRNANDQKIVNVGRITAAVALIIAVLLAPLPGNFGQAFQFIQEYTGVVSPGILAVFLAGLFYKKATNKGAIWGVTLSIPIAMYFKVAPNGWSGSVLFVNIPFMHQMLITCIATIVVIAVASWIEGKGKDDKNGITLTKRLFHTGTVFNISAVIILLILTLLYAFFW